MSSYSSDFVHLINIVVALLCKVIMVSIVSLVRRRGKQSQSNIYFYFLGDTLIDVYLNT